jgi:hypothetical protein
MNDMSDEKALGYSTARFLAGLVSARVREILVHSHRKSLLQRNIPADGKTVGGHIKVDSPGDTVLLVLLDIRNLGTSRSVRNPALSSSSAPLDTRRESPGERRIGLLRSSSG